MRQQLLDAHDRAKAQFDKLADARSMLDKVRVELTSLDKLGDLVTSEDVIKGAGKLVAAGLSPLAVAKLLSDMPEKGPAINGWLVQHATQVAGRETQLEPVLAAARHQMGVAGMRSLIGQHVEQSLGEQQTQTAAAPFTAAASNSLIPQQQAESSASTPPSGVLNA